MALNFLPNVYKERFGVNNVKISTD